MLAVDGVKAVCFELDGTLVDTAADIRYAAEEMLKDIGLPCLNAEHVSDWMGDGTDKLIHRILSRQIDGSVPDPIFRLGSAFFLKAYQRRQYATAKLYEGVDTLLRQLTRKKIPLVLVTNQSTFHANEILTVLGIRNHFSSVLGRDALQDPKPSPDGLLEAALLLGIKPEQLLMVGGSVNDVNAARAVGCKVACVSYGYNYGVDIRFSAPDCVVTSISDIATYFENNKSKASVKRTQHTARTSQSVNEKR
ncbi:HAD-IA family hydrolase [Enterovibrio baiacu]|uniref:HAD-IA family hydrolase n=1 Tax=Enterovibrio baiacu TaxID=2491023 RepID=UPI0010110B63|nr:HAD-IA family hydrolase [Enterovibrio baiacu]MBE1275138.1 HAD family hydrolase [Enterovibrio baiacu]